MLTLSLEAERDESTLTQPSLDVPRDALEPSHCSSSSNSEGTLPDTLLSLLGGSNRDAISCWISLLILPEPALIPSPNPAGNRAPD